MRVPLAVTTILIIALHGTVNAGPVRACAQVSARVAAAVRPLFANPAEGEPAANRVVAELRACLSSRNICSVVSDGRAGKEALLAGEVSTDLPARDLPEQGKSPVLFLVRSIPRVRNDSNQYCLVSERRTATTAVQQWDVYGWVIAPNAGEVLPLQKQALSDPRSLRGLAAALWFFAERMSGQPTALGARR
jgi:hypothetical protein